MDAAELKAQQAPFKNAYREAPEKALITLSARGSIDDQAIAFTFEATDGGKAVVIRVTAKVEGARMRGTAKIGDRVDGAFTAERSDWPRASHRLHGPSALSEVLARRLVRDAARCRRSSSVWMWRTSRSRNIPRRVLQGPTGLRVVDSS